MDKDELFDKLESAPNMIWWSWNQPCAINLEFAESCLEWNTRNTHETDEEDNQACQL